MGRCLSLTMQWGQHGAEAILSPPGSCHTTLSRPRHGSLLRAGAWGAQQTWGSPGGRSEPSASSLDRAVPLPAALSLR